MPILEAEALLYGLRQQLGISRNFGSRLLVLGDSLSVVLACAKGRGASDGMRFMTRRIAALTLATGALLVARWVCSEAVARAVGGNQTSRGPSALGA